MTDRFDFVAQDEGSGEPVFTGPGDGTDVIRGGAGVDYGDDGAVSPADVLIVINDLGDDGEGDDLFFSAEKAESRNDDLAPLSDDGVRADVDHIDPVLLVVANEDFWSN